MDITSLGFLLFLGQTVQKLKSNSDKIQYAAKNKSRKHQMLSAAKQKAEFSDSLCVGGGYTSSRFPSFLCHDTAYLCADIKLVSKIAVGVLNFFCNAFPVKKEIVLESNPDLACNTMEVYKALLVDKRFKDYSFTWAVKNPDKYKALGFERTDFIEYNPTSILKKIGFYKRCNRAEIVIASCKPFSKKKGNKKQINIYLDHGSQLKNMKSGEEKVRLECDYTISQAQFFIKYILNQYTISDGQIINCGIPRNDQFYRKPKDLSLIYNDVKKYKKIIAWVPTFRVSSTNRVDCDSNLPLGLPILYSIEDAISLNRLLLKNEILLIVKPHPAANLSRMKEINLSNIRFLYNDEMLGRGFQTNEFLSCCDAMITDYSGIYYDYLCLNRPVAITLDDFREYSEQHGFVFDDPLNVLKGFYIYKLSDFYRFVQEVSDGKDSCAEERNKINKMVTALTVP